MELAEIQSLISGIAAPKEVKRQAWIEYGRLLSQCPHKKRSDVGKWVAEQGLDFVESTDERAAAKRLSNYVINDGVDLTDCGPAHPRLVIKWLKETGRIASPPPKPRKPKALPVPDGDERHVEVDGEVVLAIDQDVDPSTLKKFRSSVRAAAIRATTDKNVNGNREAIASQFGLKMSDSDIEAIADKFVEMIEQINADPLKLGIVIQYLGAKTFYCAKDTRRPTEKAKAK